MIPLYWCLVTATGVAVVTVVGGWWAVGLIAVVATVLAPRLARPLLTVPLGAAIGWAVLLGRSARAPGFDALTNAVAGLFQITAVKLAGVSIGFAVAIALGGALLGSAFRKTHPRP